MKDANLSTMFLPVLAILALVFPFALQVPTNEAGNVTQTLAQPAESKSAPKAKQPNNAAALVCEFAAPDQERCKRFWEGTEQDVKKIDNFEQNVAQVETLIATVPDPKESSFDYSFDRYLEAIQRALEATGYTIDRYDLPWLKTGKESDTDQASLSRSRSAQEPGVILFRKSEKGKTSLLALFLIGETPTRGIQKAALTNALEQAKRLSQTNSTIRLLGPTFTGSATSLALTVRSWLENKNNATWRVNIISGGATGINKADFLDRSDPSGEKNRVCFAATVTQSSSDLAAFIKDYLPPQSKIAILRESNTAYGQSMSGKQKNTLELPFPLNISELRTEAEKANSGGTKRSVEANPSERRNVPLGMGQGKRKF